MKEESVIKGTAPIMLALMHLETSLVHGVVELSCYVGLDVEGQFDSVMSRKRRPEVAKASGKQKAKREIFQCSYCDQESTT